MQLSMQPLAQAVMQLLIQLLTQLSGQLLMQPLGLRLLSTMSTYDQGTFGHSAKR